MSRMAIAGAWLTRSTAFPSPQRALFALGLSPFAGWIALMAAFFVFELSTMGVEAGLVNVGTGFRFLGATVFLTILLALVIYTVGLVLVLTGLFIDSRWGAVLKLWWCLVVGALFGLLHAWLIAEAFYDPDDFIGERNPGILGLLLRDWEATLVMLLPGLASGGAFWFLSRRRAAEGEGD